MIKSKYIVAVVLGITASGAQASCFGTDSYQKCYDIETNSYYVVSKPETQASVQARYVRKEAFWKQSARSSAVVTNDSPSEFLISQIERSSAGFRAQPDFEIRASYQVAD